MTEGTSGPLIGPPATTAPAMLVMPTSTTSAAPPSGPQISGELRIDLDSMQSYVARDMQAAADEASQLVRDFWGIPTDVEMFSRAQPGLDFSAQHRAVHEVFLSTVRGVEADINKVREDLRAAVQEYRRSDEAAEEALMRASRHSLGSGELASDRAYVGAVRARTPGQQPAGPPATGPVAQPAAAQPVEEDLGGGLQ